MKELLKLAREAIKSQLEESELKIDSETKYKFSEKKACFVTLTISGELRGCIGSLEPRQELWKDVVENARSAAFSDPRFPELSLEELKKVKIEVSVLTIPRKIEYKTSDELKKKIFKKGVIIRKIPELFSVSQNSSNFKIKKGWNSATYLPQVWDELSDIEEFLSSLCRKAGLSSSAWKNLDLEVEVYEVEKVEEK